MPERKRNVHNISIYMMYCSPFSGIEPSCTFSACLPEQHNKGMAEEFYAILCKEKRHPVNRDVISFKD